jgi:hypothetical protein
MASIWGVLWIFLLLRTVFGVAIPKPASESHLEGALLPDDDPFYQNPPGFEKTALGTILRYRTTPKAITLNNITPIRPKSAWQLQYRTQNSNGEPSTSIVTVLVPYNAKPDHLLAYSWFSV